jgi:TrmH family RNA methyltransferase
MSKRALAAAARLRDPEERRRRRETLLEGPRLFAEAIAAGAGLRQVFATVDDPIDRAALERGGCEVIIVDAAGLKRVASTPNPQGPIAVMSVPTVAASAAGNALVMAGLSDPGNVGTLIRSAAAFDWNVICAGDMADPWSPKVMRAAAGGHFRAPPESMPELDLEQLRGRGYSTAAAVVAGGLDPTRLPARRWALLVGHEARGLSAAAVDAADCEVTIPMTAGTGSLNAGVAGAILMFLMAGVGAEPHH